MSRKFNGTSDTATVSIDLSGFNVLSIAFWLWWDAFANDDTMATEYGTGNQSGGFWLNPGDSGNGWGINFFVNSSGIKSWHDTFPRPSAAAWHHYVIVMNRSSRANLAYVDGVAQTLTIQTHQAVTYGNFANLSLALMSRNAASLFGAGRLAEYAIWGGVTLTATQAKALAQGATPNQVYPDNLKFYAPLLGDSPTPDYSGNRKSLTLTGTTITNHPPARTLLATQGRGGHYTE